MTRQAGPPINPDHLAQGSPTNALFTETIPWYVSGTDNAISATGVAHATAVALQAGDIVTNITFTTGGTAAVTPTAGYVALYSNASTPALLAQSADFATTARAANTDYIIALATPQLITVPGIYYVSISFTAATIPTLRGATVGNLKMADTHGLTVPSAPKVKAQSHGSAVGAVAPATITSGTVVATPVYFILT